MKKIIPYQNNTRTENYLNKPKMRLSTNNNPFDSNNKKSTQNTSGECRHSFEGPKSIIDSLKKKQKNEQPEKSLLSNITNTLNASITNFSTSICSGNKEIRESGCIRENKPKSNFFSTQNIKITRKSPKSSVPIDNENDKTFIIRQTLVPEGITEPDSSKTENIPYDLFISKPKPIITNENTYGIKPPQAKSPQNKALSISNISPLSTEGLKYLNQVAHNKSISSASLFSQNKILSNICEKRLRNQTNTININTLINAKSLERDENVYFSTQPDIENNKLGHSDIALKSLTPNSIAYKTNTNLYSKSARNKFFSDAKKLFTNNDSKLGSDRNISPNSTACLKYSMTNKEIEGLSKEQLTNIQFHNNIKYLEQSLRNKIRDNNHEFIINDNLNLHDRRVSPSQDLVFIERYTKNTKNENENPCVKSNEESNNLGFTTNNPIDIFGVSNITGITDMDNDKNSKIMNIISHLKNKLTERELEIMNLKNDKLKSDIENQNLLMQIKDMILQNKKNQQKIEILQEKLNEKDAKHKELLLKTTTIPTNTTTTTTVTAVNVPNTMDSKEDNLEDLLGDQKSSDIKIKAYEQAIAEKSKELELIQERLTMMTIKNTKLESEINDYINQIANFKKQISENNDIITTLQQEIAKNSDLKKQYHNIEKKIVELEDMQNNLILENETLRMYISLQKEQNLNKINNQGKTQNDNNAATDMNQLSNYGFNTLADYKKILSRILFASNKKLNEIEDIIKKLLIVLDYSLKGEDPPIELILKFGKKHMGKKCPNDKDDLIGLIDTKHVSQGNNVIIDNIHKILIKAMDNISSSYVQKYDNECNLQ